MQNRSQKDNIFAEQLTQNMSARWERLSELHNNQNKACFRLIHDLKDHFQIDIYGATLWMYWYNDFEVPASVIESVESFCKLRGLNYVIRHMINRGQGVGGKEQSDLIRSKNQPDQWTAFESNVQYQLRKTAGFSPGLFLDQSQNRKWVLENSKSKNVLNLFSYTSGFSVNAALGGASSVTTVDASSNFLNWSKENFKLNNLDPEKFDFFAQDSLLFLAGAHKRNRQWDLIICDPPSFGRTKTTVWKIEKDLPELIQKMWSCLAANGRILFTCNYEKWTLKDLENVFRKTLANQKFKFEKLPEPSIDFKLEGAEQNLMKGFFIQKLK